MNISLKNSYKNHFENLFVWTGKSYNPGWCGSSNNHIEIMPWTWQRWTMGLGGTEVDAVCRNITENSVDVKRVGSYFCSVFTDLNPGRYMLSLDSSIDMTFYINRYLKQDDGKYMFITNSSTLFTAGYNQYVFSVEDGFCIRLDFGNDGIWGTLSNLRIVEA